VAKKKRSWERFESERLFMNSFKNEHSLMIVGD